MAKTCENCGCRVYSLGCVNCNEAAYIEEQRNRADIDEYWQEREKEKERHAHRVDR